jgi:toxin HigB-1
MTSLALYPQVGYSALMDVVDLSKVKKLLKKTPIEVIKRLQRWIKYVETIGLLETRKIPGLHDEPLLGKWKGFRSVRLGKKWRVIYKHNKEKGINIALIEEVTPHDY